MLVILHAYSRRNSGDGLLVDETLRVAALAGFPVSDCTVVALDSESFREDSGPGLVQYGPATGTASRVVFGAQQLARQATGRLAAVLDDADAILGVGGGYLRAGDAVEGIKTGLAHLAQLQAAARRGEKSIYMPQSIGPLRGPVGAALRSSLARLSSVHVRDDRSAGELGPATRVQRTPDLAVLRLASAAPTSTFASAAGRPVLVARALKRGAAYEARLLELLARLPRPLVALQSSVGGNDDREFYRRLGLTGPFPTLQQVLENESPGVVVSVRLHGSLQALLGGWPTVHLSYERKGFGAMRDLNLTEYVRSAWQFEARWVDETVRQIRESPASYWSRIETVRPHLRAAEKHLVDDISRLRAKTTS